MEQNEIDIAGIVEFAGSELAHRQHGEAAAGLGIGGVGQQQVTTIVAGAQQMGDSAVQRRLGQCRQRRGHAVERPDAAYIGDSRGQRDLALGLAQLGCELWLGECRLDLGQSVHGARHDHLRAAQNQQSQGRVFAQCEIGEIGAVAAQAYQQLVANTIGQPCLGSPEGGKSFEQPPGRSGIGWCWPDLGKNESAVVCFGAHVQGWT